MTSPTRTASHWPFHPRPHLHPFAGVVAGLVGGGVYLLAQLVLAGALATGDAWLPLERIAAMLLGEDAIYSRGFNVNLAGIGLLIHIAVSMVYGRVVDAIVRDASVGVATLLGAGTGIALYAVAFGIIAPSAFPWFEQSPVIITAVDHALFGATAGFVYAILRRRWRSPES